MFIRIEFENIESAKTRESQGELFSRPNGMFLSSANARMICPKEIYDKVGYSIVFYYIDVDILNKYYGGVITCLNSLFSYSGVKCVDVLPIEGQFDERFKEKCDEVCNIIIKYINGVV